MHTEAPKLRWTADDTSDMNICRMLLQVAWVGFRRCDITVTSLEHHDISSHQQLDCLFNSLLGLTTKQTIIKLCITGPFVRGIHRWPVDSLYKGPVMQNAFLCQDVIIFQFQWLALCVRNQWPVMHQLVDPVQSASNSKNVPTSWYHHEI